MTDPPVGSGVSARVLVVEDSSDDAALVERTLRAAGFDLTSRRVETAEEMATALAESSWDAILADYRLPHFSGTAALAQAGEHDPDLPVLIVSGTIGEEVAVELMRAGARDYVLKQNLTRLPQALERELRVTEKRRQRRRAEAELRASQERFRILTEHAPVGIFQAGADGAFSFVNETWCQMSGLDADRSLGDGWLAAVHFADRDATVETWRAAVAAGTPWAHDFRSADGSSTTWIHGIATPMIDDDGAVVGYLGTGSDITGRLEAEQKLRDSLLRLRESFLQTTESLASLTEVRDTFTAGHQRRVAELSWSIAVEMGLPGDTTEGLRLAALLHDVGKIHIPVEILTKPGTLNELEWRLIKTHADAGYEILAPIEYPWPIAEIARQHHERLDGSGYPRGLMADETLLEAKVIAVADVVEAMSSNRPYRPALGVDAALAEVEANKGTKFLPAAVEACVALFREGRFAFSDDRPGATLTTRT